LARCSHILQHPLNPQCKVRMVVFHHQLSSNFSKDNCNPYLAAVTLLGFDLVSLTTLLLGIPIHLTLILLMKQSVITATWSFQLSISSLTCCGCFGSFLIPRDIEATQGPQC
jgi:hypothetical protein